MIESQQISDNDLVDQEILGGSFSGFCENSILSRRNFESR
jgi:hypothetical protein